MAAEQRRHTYGPDAAQYSELYRPQGHPLGIAVLVHGGFWRSAFDASLGRPLAADLIERGWVAYNIEYRRVGNGGGWPATFQDVSDAIDLLADLDLDTSQVIAVGHSAGGHLATWAAGRSPLGTPGALGRPGAPGRLGPPARVPLTAVVAQAGVLDLANAAITHVGGTACRDLLGGKPDEVPERYAYADPIARVPLSVPVVCVHSRTDEFVPFAQSEAFVAATAKAGGSAELVEVSGSHMAHIEPASKAWAAVVDWLPRLLQPIP
jgi:acetyl esterase/lipase